VITPLNSSGEETILAYLLAASLLWALSFGLIKGHLVAYDPLAVAFLRLAISSVLFLPWLLQRPLSTRLVRRAMILGAVQFGLMYIFYIAAYQYLPAYAVALYTIFTPLYVTGLEDALTQRWQRRHTVAALLAVVGAAMVTAGDFVGNAALRGIGLLQLSNLCFAAGQVGYRRLLIRSPRVQPSPSAGQDGGTVSFHHSAPPGQERGSWTYQPVNQGLQAGEQRSQAGGVSEVALLGWMYLGATMVTAVISLVFADRSRLDFGGDAVLVLLYLGLVPTALGFYLWNKGAVRVGAGVLAAANNLKIPLAVLCTWLIFSESANYVRVIGGLAVIVAALFVAGRRTEIVAGRRTEND
jgi:drug/metabolite transporter (DMT)-like permease